MMSFLFLLLSFALGSTPTQVLHSTFSTCEDAQGWVRFHVDDINKITSIVLYKRMQDILYPTKDYTPFVYYDKGKVENLNDCKMDATNVELNSKTVPEFWTHNKAYIMVIQQDVYNVIMLTSTKPTTRTPTTETPTTRTPITETPITEAPTTETPITEAPTTEAPTTEAPTTETPTTETPTTETPTTETPTTETPTTKKPEDPNNHDVKSANTASSVPQEWLPHKNVAIILLCAFVTLFLVLLVVVTFRKSYGAKKEDDDRGNDFFANHKKNDDDFSNVITVVDDPEKDMQILMALGKGAKPSFRANLYNNDNNQP